MHRLAAITLLVLLTVCEWANSANDDPMRAVVEQAAVLDSAPTLASGDLQLDAEALTDGAFVWIEVEQDGLYSLSMSNPGALVLASFPTTDGRYDGVTRPIRHLTTKSLDQALIFQSLLLSTAHPYLLSASSSAGASTLALKLVEAVPSLSETPPEVTAVLPGDSLYAANRLELTVPGNTDRRRIEVIGEVRAKLSTGLGSKTVPTGGRYPWISGDDARLTVTATAGKESTLPRILVRMTPEGIELDESEPNESVPSRLEIGKIFKGHLLKGDLDRIAFDIKADMNLDFSVKAEASGQYSVDLLRIEDKKETPLLRRKLSKEALREETFSLISGQYVLVLTRIDVKDAPLPYTVMLTTGTAVAPNKEAEPNDTPASAMPLQDSLRVSGSAATGDLDVYQFTVPDDKSGHLWRVFTMNADRIQLTNKDGSIADVRATGRRAMADALALNPGNYLVTIHAKGDYLLRVLDQGPRPSDFEGEPNDNFADGQRLAFGAGIRGAFHRLNDLDYYLFRLDSASAVKIEVHPTSDGLMDVKLYRDNTQMGGRMAFKPGEGPYVFESNLPPGDWSLVVRSLEPSITENYEVSVERLAGIAGHEPDNDPLDAIKLPRDGDFAGSVGAFDPVDQVFIPLPQGTGQAALVCAYQSEHPTGRARVYHWSDASKIADINQGIAVFSYGPELGGALRLGMNGTEYQIPYQCAMRFAPIDSPPPATPVSPTSAMESTDSDRVIPLMRGQTRQASINEEGLEPGFALDLEENEIAFVSCRNEAGDVLPSATRIWAMKDTKLPSRELLGDLTPIKAGARPLIQLSRTYAQRMPETTLPMLVDCTLYGIDDLPRPADMGPPAEVQIFETMAPATLDNATRPSGPPPPGLEALIKRETPEKQAAGDLPVTISLEPIPELAAFSEAGQRFTVQSNLTNDASTEMPVSVSLNITGEGWRITPVSQKLTLAPGSTKSVLADIVAPPWLTPSLSPALTVRVDLDAAFNSAIADITISPSVVPVAPFTHWHAPQALRGGLNVLHYGLGARLIDWGGKVPDERLQKGESGLHDGLAPHIVSVNLPIEGIAFELAAKAEIAGLMIQLRSTTQPQNWPAEVEVYAPAGETGWRRVAAGTLESTHAPQYLVFDEVITAKRLRFGFPRCFEKCPQPWVQEIQAIAVPGSHPPDLPPINIADPELGGHVVWANHNFAGNWNDGLLIAKASASNTGWTRANVARQLQAVVAFHQNRAALIKSVNWVGDPDDTKRIPMASVEASMDGPNGPWSSLGQLLAPPPGETHSTLTFEEPVWVRYLRFGFESPAKEALYGPDAIEVIEAPGTSVLGLWQDDEPRAAFEAANKAEPSVPVAPAGGPDRDKAVMLPLATPIESSVVIERNEDWWRVEVPQGPPAALRLEFERTRPLVVAELLNLQGQPIALKPVSAEQVLEAILTAGEYLLRIYEPPRSVVISWDTSGSVSHYIPRAVAAVRTWGRSLQPGRDALQLLPFGPNGFLLESWAETPEVLEPVLRELPQEQSSASETAMFDASIGLAERRGARGIVMMTDAETGMDAKMWPALLEAMPRVIALSVDSDSRQNAAIMMDWATANNGHFQRVIGPLGLADSLDMANALFRAPKAYGLIASLEELIEPEGETTLTVTPAADAESAIGGVELILDASGSMLQKIEGRRRIDVAHDALTELVLNTLPEGTPFAFRAFGLEEDACHSELVIPLGPLERASAAKAIAAVPAINLAKTAIADSLRAVISDLEGATPPRVVVLVTDGEETCGGDPDAAIAELRASGLDARVNIVGFAIDDAALAETFASWAETGGGTYFDANGAEALERSIADALRPRFDITRTYLDGTIEVVGNVALGEKITVPAGSLTITPGSGASGLGVTVQAQAGKSIVVDYTPTIGLDAADDSHGNEQPK